MPSVARRVVTWLALVVGAYLVWVLALFLGQTSLLYPGRAFPVAAEPSPGEGVEVWTLDASFGGVEAWYHPPGRPEGHREGGAGAALLFAHGNGERIDDWVGAFRPLAERGVAVLLVEYPGYGRSDGAPSQASITEAMVLAHDRLADRPEVDPDRIVGMGRSLGGGAVASLARERSLRALVLMSSFTSVESFAGRYGAPPFLVRDRFEVLDVVRRFEGPVLVVHGRGDRIIPYRHGEALAEAGPRGTLLTLDCAHNDCPPDWRAWLRDLLGFLAENGIHAPDGAESLGG